MDVGVDEAFLGFAIGALGGRGGTLLAKDGDGGVEVAVGFNKRALAVHEAGARLGAQVVDLGGGDCSAH